MDTKQIALFGFLGLFLLFLQSQAADSSYELLCPICSYVSTSESALQVHVNNHLDASSEQNNDPESNCPLCSYVSTDANELQNHVYRHLTAEAPEENPSAPIRAGPKAGQTNDIDDRSTFTKSIMPVILSIVTNSTPDVNQTFIDTDIDHYATGDYDNGWGAGYRNVQMMFSSIFQNMLYTTTICETWHTYNLYRGAMPSILEIQRMIEFAWTQGYDEEGATHFDSELINTKKWLGASDIIALFRSLGLNSQLIDFHRPTSEDGRHPELFNWVLNYFKTEKDKHPLLLQRQGFSQVIIGIEETASNMTLFTLDPNHNPHQIATLGLNTIRLLRHEMNELVAEQYQIVAIRGAYKGEEEKEASKVLRSVRIPDDDILIEV